VAVLNNQCAACPRKAKFFRGPVGTVSSDGAIDAPLMIVDSLLWTESEIEAGKAFVEAGGWMLWTWLEKVGIHRGMTRIVNVSSCWPCGPRGASISMAQGDACSTRLWQEISEARPRVMLLLGGEALKRVTGLPGGLDGVSTKVHRTPGNRGYMIRVSELPLRKTRVPVELEYKTSKKLKDGSWLYRKGDPRTVYKTVMLPPPIPASVEWIIATYHPSYIMKRKRRILRAFIQDLGRCARMLRGEARPLEIKWVEDLVPTAPGLATLDIETDGKEGAINRVGIATDEITCTTPWSSRAEAEVRRIADDPTRTVSFHNSAFDVSRFARYGIAFKGRLYDSMIGGMMLEPHLPKGLASMAPLYLDVERWKHHGESPDPFLQAKYNAKDAGHQHAMTRTHLRLLEKYGMLNLAMDTIMPSLRVLRAMTERGIRVDTNRLEKWTDELTDQSIAALGRWYELQPTVDPKKNNAVETLLYRELYLDAVFHPVTGAFTTDVNAVRQLMTQYPEHHELLSRLLEVRRVEKLLTTYTTIPVHGDGCVHPQYLPQGKDQQEGKGQGSPGTGRLAASNPNIQNVAKDDENARGIYIPRHPGWKLISIDYSQMELRIMAWASRDDALIRIITNADNTGSPDVFQLWANENLISRDASKVGFYATLYGAQKKKVAMAWKQGGFDLGEDAADRFQRSIARTAPRLWAYRQYLVERGVAQTYLTNHFDRRRWFFQGPQDAPAMMDFIPQGDSADIMWTRLIPLEDTTQSLGANLLTIVHDEALVEAPPGSEHDVARACQEIMQAEFNQIAPGFRCPTGVKIGDDWGRVEKVKL